MSGTAHNDDHGSRDASTHGTPDGHVPGRAPMGPALRAVAMLVAFTGTVAFSVVLAHLTLEPSVASESLTHSNLRPGDSISDYLSRPALRDTVKQLGGNIVLGIPFGLLLPVLAPRARGLLRVMIVTAITMLLVELVQGALVTGRAFDIDDVILNTTGAMLGYLLLGRRLGRAVHPRRHHWWHRWTKKRAVRTDASSGESKI
ncbi:MULTISPECIES: VanZ family protein [Streptomyces]|uniref:VanZ family protein n=1 Tax=Streptomyces TaxID=1883 RepID=UPI0019BDF502|nr:MULTISPECIES: VanZ family protein [Streptomyces]GGT78596.1 VanZ family protein [Streptomyces lateritius]